MLCTILPSARASIHLQTILRSIPLLPSSKIPGIFSRLLETAPEPGKVHLLDANLDIRVEKRFVAQTKCVFTALASYVCIAIQQHNLWSRSYVGIRNASQMIQTSIVYCQTDVEKHFSVANHSLK